MSVRSTTNEAGEGRSLRVAHNRRSAGHTIPSRAASIAAVSSAWKLTGGNYPDRQPASVEQPAEPAISLKAGGLGLNLTKAEYVFLLDPWWNPAVEAQAIDRAHRIGQTLPIFAYRLIARDTVEEKVLQLQKSKRALADAIISADNSLIRQIRREDLELLLS
jgi:hypothetical protein